MMGDALMAVDAGQSRLQSWDHALLCSLRHLMNIHGTYIVATAALA